MPIMRILVLFEHQHKKIDSKQTVPFTFYIRILWRNIVAQLFNSLKYQNNNISNKKNLK